MSSDAAVPRATYRVQLHAGFTFDDAASIAAYLSDLGISHLYCSPYLQARSGSTHGYDVVDHHRVSEELGGTDGHARLLNELTRVGMGHILDIVPNHMAVGERANRWWWDVLRNGPGSRYASYFDINWDPPTPKLRWVVHCPVLGDQYGRVIDAGDIKLERDGDEIVVRYFEHTFPVSPTSLTDLAGDDDVDGFVSSANADPGVMHELLEKQHYRLAHWKTAGQELNYRRFFAINELVALRVEIPAVFDAVHALVLDLIRSGKLDGVRVDHIDGLRDPEDYLQRLSAEARGAYIVVEKILEPDEALPASWPVHGTTGYDFLTMATGVLIDRTAERPLTDLYTSFTGVAADLPALRREKKQLLLETELATDVERLTDLFVDVCESYPRHRDFTRNDLRAALIEVLTAFPVYRTYVRNERASDQDVRVVTEAIQTATERRGDLDPELFMLLGDVLLMRTPNAADRALALRFQQTSGPVMAKGVEDTLFYVYNRFVALNEVGGDPSRFGISLDGFHAFNSARAERWPDTMLATSTHDTKRSEDVRARIALLSEIPDDWRTAVLRWSAHNERHRRDGMPDRNMEYLLYQSAVGTWVPGDETWGGRMAEYMTKSSKEAKVHTSWIDPDPDYDEPLRAFVDAVVADPEFLADLEDFVTPLIDAGFVNSLAQTLLKLTAPGVPDIYQGQETWDFSLVDPDNRRTVDYAQRRALLARVAEIDGRTAWSERARGSPKMMVTRRTLALRSERPDAFRGAYEPLRARGPAADHIVAFARGEEVVTAVPRLPLTVGGRWAGTTLELPDGAWRNDFTDNDHSGAVDAASLFDAFPVALLVRKSA